MAAQTRPTGHTTPPRIGTGKRGRTYGRAVRSAHTPNPRPAGNPYHDAISGAFCEAAETITTLRRMSALPGEIRVAEMFVAIISRHRAEAVRKAGPVSQ